MRVAGERRVARRSRPSRSKTPENTTRTPGSPPDHHRNYNRHGEAFDVGETFSGVPYEVAVVAAREVTTHAPAAVTTAQLALRWVIEPGVTAVIPGAGNAQQARANAAVAAIDPLPTEAYEALAKLVQQPHFASTSTPTGDLALGKNECSVGRTTRRREWNDNERRQERREAQNAASVVRPAATSAHR